MANVKVFVDKQTYGQTELYAHIHRCRGIDTYIYIQWETTTVQFMNINDVNPTYEPSIRAISPFPTLFSFHLFEELSSIFIKFEIVCKLFGRV